MTESLNYYFTTGSLTDCGYCKGKQRCGDYTILTAVQLEYMRKHKPYVDDQPFCKVCMVRIKQRVDQFREHSRNLSSQSITSRIVNSSESSDSSNNSRNRTRPGNVSLDTPASQPIVVTHMGAPPERHVRTRNSEYPSIRRELGSFQDGRRTNGG